MKQLLLITFLLVGSIVLAQDKVKLKMETSLGTIKLEVYPSKAPITVKNFLRYVDAELYDSSTFYRVVRMDNQPKNDVKIEVIQGGLGGTKRQRFEPIEHETTEETGIKHENGTISMARSTPGSARAEIFICINPQPSLDYKGLRNPDLQGFAAFGKVTSGMKVVEKIQAQKTDGQTLLERVMILSIKRIN